MASTDRLNETVHRPARPFAPCTGVPRQPQEARRSAFPAVCLVAFSILLLPAGSGCCTLTLRMAREFGSFPSLELADGICDRTAPQEGRFVGESADANGVRYRRYQFVGLLASRRPDNTSDPGRVLEIALPVVPVTDQYRGGRGGESRATVREVLESAEPLAAAWLSTRRDSTSPDDKPSASLAVSRAQRAGPGTPQSECLHLGSTFGELAVSIAVRTNPPVGFYWREFPTTSSLLWERRSRVKYRLLGCGYLLSVPLDIITFPVSVPMALMSTGWAGGS